MIMVMMTIMLMIMMMLTKSMKEDLSSHHDPAVAIEGVLPREDLPFFLNPRHSFSTWNQSLRMILIFVKDTKIILIVEKGTKIILIVEKDTKIILIIEKGTNIILILVKQTSLQELLSSLNVPLSSLQSRIGKFYPLDLRKWKLKSEYQSAILRKWKWESANQNNPLPWLLSPEKWASVHLTFCQSVHNHCLSTRTVHIF